MLKRLFDIVASFSGLVLLSPVIAIVAWKISQKLGSPVLFRQVRPGKDGKPFEMVKFRTMLDAVDSNGQPLPDDERMTPFGSFLRSSSLDELPELWNVLKGDMSLVGPGRNAISWEDKFKLDVWYVDNRSLWLDIKIIFLTIKKVLVRDGISADGEATMAKFTGTK